MEFVAVLWLPILLSAVAVFLVSSVFHMVLPIHKGDAKGLANEEAVAEALRTGGVQPGEYMMPFCGDMKEMGTPEYKAKLDRGPVLIMTVMPNGSLNMGRSLINWFIYSLIVGLLAGYAGWHSLGRGADFGTVLRVTATMAILPYGVAYYADYIWRGRSAGIVLKYVFEGVVYGLATGLVFAWLWPGV